ncbi:hypothetical protein [Pedobacter roseus]|uniref:Uncharacterized protein n=1 Tax=Pedobacter roseus TaxID=336820 RepID=A0A7G9Q9Z6_9SPHI|nr:hypothetical protein [Pedobacter roseus]QNN40171.1 hypothetical protein H9L23_13495 [Pedobacter roseus]
MEALDNIFTLEPKELLEGLPNFQVKLITEMSESGYDYLTIADNWLNTKPKDTVGFGGQPLPASNNIYRDKIMHELEKFICGDEKYEDERKKLSATAGQPIQFILGGISAAIGSVLGTAGAFILPVIVLLLMTGGKISKNGWCEARKELRAASGN